MSLLKVCGMRDHQNIKELNELNPDMIGFIFYESSKRYALGNSEFDTYVVHKAIKKIGVVVDAPKEYVENICVRYELDGIQLHGKESSEYCLYFKNKYLILKAINIQSGEDFEMCREYQGKVDYFLFDTKGELPGGNGSKFEWDILDQYTLSTPYLLSGGIELDDVSTVKKLLSSHEQMVGVDINSKFELSPGLKDIQKIRQFKNALAGS